MKLKGEIVEGVARGWEMIENFLPRLKHIIGYEPFKGTLDIEFEEPVEIELHATKKISHLLLHGDEIVYAYLAPIKLVVKDRENKLIEHECWAIRQTQNPFRKNILEIIDKESIKEKYNLKIGDKVEVIFEKAPKVKNTLGNKIRTKLKKRETRITR